MQYSFRSCAVCALLLTGCGSEAAVGRDAGLATAPDAATRDDAPDAGEVSASDAGEVSALDAGLADAPDAGEPTPSEAEAMMRTNAALRRLREVNCECDAEEFATAEECAGFGPIAEVAACEDVTYRADLARLGGFFSCLADAFEAQAECAAAAACDRAALEDCELVAGARAVTCPPPPREAAVAFAEAQRECVLERVIGPAGVCPRSDAAVSTLGGAVFSGSTLGAGDDFEPVECSPGSSADLTFRWLAPRDGEYTFDTFGSDFDTVLYLVSDCEATTQLACNDDADDGPPLRSSVTAPVAGGQEVLIVVEGHSSQNAGDVVVNISTATIPL